MKRKNIPFKKSTQKKIVNINLLKGVFNIKNAFPSKKFNINIEMDNPLI